jgi:hypothetical protein
MKYDTAKYHWPPDATATLTVRRPDQDITVALGQWGLWEVMEALDENGNPVALTPKEEVDVCVRATHGEDETGR